MGVTRKLIQYALLYKKSIFLALVMLVIATMADLSGPFVAKRMINHDVLGIEQTWYAVKPGTPGTVSYHGADYRRADAMPADAKHGKAGTVVQAGTSFYFVDRPLPFTANAKFGSGHLTVRIGQQTVTAQASPLSNRQLFAFYRPNIPNMWRLAILYFCLILISAGFTYGEQLVLQISANGILKHMRRDVFRHIHRLPIRYFSHTPAGKIVSRITNDTETLRDFYVMVLANVMTSFITMIGIYVALFILNVHLALICITLLPILGIWVWLYRRYAVEVNHKIRTLLSDINATINETLQGIPVIRAFNRQDRTLDEFSKVNGEFYKHQTKLLTINSATSHNLANVLRNIFLISLISYFGWRSFHLVGLISFGTLYAFVDYLGRLFGPVVQVVNQLSNLEQARVSAERVFLLLDEPGTDVTDGDMTRYRGDVRFEDVHFSYDGETDVLHGISFAARQGETVALVGHTGSGKSSIMNLLFRFFDVRTGQITIDGMNIAKIPHQYLRKHMGIVLQDPFLFTGTIANNVNLGDEAISREQIDHALRNVGADKLLCHLPNGWDEPVLENGSTLSAGQRQLISFARALAFNPAILVLDEATSNIDTETEAVIQEALEVLKRGRTTFIIAHRLSTIRNADLILVLDKGQIVERGCHDELLRAGGRYAHMYQLQQGNAAAQTL